MEELFLLVFQLGMSAGWLITAVIPARFLLKRAPKNIICILWLVVGIRLICPFQIESAFSLLPEKNAAATDGHVGIGTFHETARTDFTAVPAADKQNQVLRQPRDVEKKTAKSRGNRFDIITVAAWVWFFGTFLMASYLALGWLRMKRKVAASVPDEYEGIKFYRCDHIASPFLFGFIRPKIYVPFSLSGQELFFVLMHEKVHKIRLDHLIKISGFLLLSVYWFHPLVWTAYILLCRDLELACDEKVIRELGDDCKKAYSKALLSCAAESRRGAAYPVAFGEIGVKERVKNILNYKKPKFWVSLAAVVVCIAVTVCFATEAESRSVREPGKSGAPQQLSETSGIKNDSLKKSLETADAQNGKLKALTVQDVQRLSAKRGELELDDFSPYIDLMPLQENGSLSELLTFDYNGEKMYLRIYASDKKIAAAPYEGALDAAVVFPAEFLNLDTIEKEFNYDGSCADIRSGNLEHILNGTVEMDDYMTVELPKGLSKSGYKYWMGSHGGVYFINDREADVNSGQKNVNDGQVDLDAGETDINGRQTNVSARETGGSDGQMNAAPENIGLYAEKPSIGGIEIFENGEMVRSTTLIQEMESLQLGNVVLKRGIFLTEPGISWYAAYTELEGSQISYCFYLNRAEYTEKEFLEISDSRRYFHRRFMIFHQ